ncbi:GNAT family N-acetyltransferase [Streptomyces sp. NPDC047315]|uniref:GNAT family N-acetyltransferase n=1 Tax=Streptomyces sp. NPDC047315 TaxID=3155142 RepID=UPI0033DCA7A1
MSARDGGAASGAVEVRELHAVDDLEAAVRLFDAIWRPGPAGGPINVELLRALAHSGNYVAGAFGGPRLIGASVGFLAAPPGRALHSHVTGTTEPGGGCGLALKHHQRTWALRRGLTRITWTFDPLVRRNAYFNLVKLGASLVEYHPAFYGVMQDSVNDGDESDRALALWRLDAAPSGAAQRPSDDAPERLLAAGDDGRPVLRTTDARTVLVELPPDVEALRRTDRAAARSWRYALREVLGGLLADGARVSGFHDRRGYLVTRPTSPVPDPAEPRADRT